MGFFTLIKSLDELLYEVMSWLVFYPVTLWRSIRHPLGMMNYADAELGDASEEQYADTLSPPLFLLLTLLLGRALELSLVGEGAIVQGTRGLQILISSDTALIMLRVVIFSVFPMVFSVRLIRAQGVKLTRETLKPPFYSQCYAAAPFAMLTGLSGALSAAQSPTGDLLTVGGLALALLWYGSLQVRWFGQHLGCTAPRAWMQASIAMIECLIAVGWVAWLFSGRTLF